MFPWLARRIIFPLQEMAMSRPTMSYFRDLERTQWSDRESLEALQQLKLNQLLGTALAHCPWHAERFQRADLIEPITSGRLTLTDLKRLPTMTKADARANIDRLVWRSVPGGAHQYNTGGSSGEPLIFYFGRQRQASDAAGRMRARRWWGVEPGDREAYLWGAPVELNKADRIKTARDRLINQLVLNAFAMSPTRMDEYLERLARWQPVCIYGYASSVALLAAHAEARCKLLRWQGLKVVCTTGEPLYADQRELISRVLGVPVANEFGSRDIGFMAHESPDGNLLFMSESHILEVLDEQANPVTPGSPGEAVITGLTSAAQPFIRYRTGDIVRLSATREAAGRGLHVLEEVTGRSTDFVVHADGTIMHALAIIYAVRGVDGVAQFKCVQHTPLEMDVQIVPNSAWTALSAEKITAGLKARLSSAVRITIIEMDSIAPEASGKHRYVVSHVYLPAELKQAVA